MKYKILISILLLSIACSNTEKKKSQNYETQKQEQNIKIADTSFADNKSKQKNTKAISFKLNIEYIRDYSMKIYEGTFIYHLNEKEISVTIHYDIVDMKDTTVFTKKINNDALLAYFSNLNLDTLKSEYNNKKIMFCSGTSLYIKYKKENKIKEIYLHCYSHNTINNILLNINKLVPDKYKFKLYRK